MNSKQKIIDVLKKGGVIVFPTDTVWGVGAWMGSKTGINKFYKIKNREESKPSQILVSSVVEAKKLGKFNAKAEELIERFWPGGLTIVVEAKGDKVPNEVRGGKLTVGLRVPDQVELLELLDELGGGMVASSANFAGGVAPNKFDEIEKIFLDKIDLIMEGESGEQPSSTVVEVIGDEIKVLREGVVRVN